MEKTKDLVTSDKKDHKQWYQRRVLFFFFFFFFFFHFLSFSGFLFFFFSSFPFSRFFYFLWEKNTLFSTVQKEGSRNKSLNGHLRSSPTGGGVRVRVKLLIL
eukprot:TRINITY_DN6231_c0_g1_i28.p2 TRINITY_DN6231_c0_g1~~TRINITY_DN6231_c0_g1_i28.p2  ORF type:complete len:102 (-),score=25.43 TRINITY_DN6231_c0_g1_i28:1332-1637(-)